MTWGVIQSAGNNSFGTSVAATFTTQNVASGNKIVAAVASSWHDAPSTVQDAAANNWTLLGSEVSSTPALWLYGLDVPLADAGTKPTITVAFPSSNGQSVLVQEVSGLLPGNTTAMIDGTAAGLAGTAASTGSPSYSSAAAGEYLVCFYGDNNGNSTVTKTDASWTLDPNNQHTFSSVQLEYKASTGGAETSGFTGANSGGWVVLTVAFNVPAAAGTPSAPYGFPAMRTEVISRSDSRIIRL